MAYKSSSADVKVYEIAPRGTKKLEVTLRNFSKKDPLPKNLIHFIPFKLNRRQYFLIYNATQKDVYRIGYTNSKPVKIVLKLVNSDLTALGFGWTDFMPFVLNGFYFLAYNEYNNKVEFFKMKLDNLKGIIAVKIISNFTSISNVSTFVPFKWGGKSRFLTYNKKSGKWRLYHIELIKNRQEFSVFNEENGGWLSGFTSFFSFVFKKDVLNNDYLRSYFFAYNKDVPQQLNAIVKKINVATAYLCGTFKKN
jgi:hypothetical protein